MNKRIQLTNNKIMLNGKTYSESYLYEPTHGDLECDFYNLAFAAIVEWKKRKKKEEAKANRNLQKQKALLIR